MGLDGILFGLSSFLVLFVGPTLALVAVVAAGLWVVRRAGRQFVRGVRDELE